MAGLQQNNSTDLAQSKPEQGNDLRERVLVHAFLTKIITSKDSFSYQELVDVSKASKLIQKHVSDPKLIELMNGRLVPDSLRKALGLCGEINNIFEKIKTGSTRITLAQLKQLNTQAQRLNESRFKEDSLPNELRLLERFDAARQSLVGAIESQTFGSFIILSERCLKSATKLVELSEAGGTFQLSEMYQLDASDIECRIIRAQRERKKAGGDCALAAAIQRLNKFELGDIRQIFDYVRRTSGESKIEALMNDLVELASFAEVRDLETKTKQFVAGIAKLCAYDQSEAGMALKAKPIDGIGRLVAGCISAMTQGMVSHERGRKAPEAGLNGFLSEVTIANNLIQKGWQIIALDQLKNGKETDIIAKREGKTIFVEVKDNWLALKHSLQSPHGPTQLKAHINVANKFEAQPVLIIHHTNDLSLGIKDDLSTIKSQSVTYPLPLLVWDGQFRSIDLSQLK